MNTPPTPNDITVFLSTFAKLDQFEVEHRAIAGWGVWHQDTPLPIPEVARVIKWLQAFSLTLNKDKLTVSPTTHNPQNP
jgi:hypothetical protein